MTMRHSSALLGLCVAIATMVLLSPALAQAQARGGEQWVVPRTSDGHPDLQGNWTNQTITPMQRREGQDRILTWDEVAEREGRVVERSQAGAEASDPDRPPLEAGSNVGAYNNVYFEFGQRVAIVNGEPLSSLITSPDNGRRPALTPEGARRRDERRRGQRWRTQCREEPGSQGQEEGSEGQGEGKRLDDSFHGSGIWVERKSPHANGGIPHDQRPLCPAWQAIPSFVPSKPNPSVVVALQLTYFFSILRSLEIHSIIELILSFIFGCARPY